MEFDRFVESFKIWNVRRNFNGARYSFYKELAAAMRSGGSLLPLIKEYSVANEKTIAPMMKNWLIGFEKNPDSLGAATKPYVDVGDSAVLSAVDKSGAEGYDLLSTYAVNLRQRKKMMSAFTSPLFIPAIALVILAIITYVFGTRVFPPMLAKIPLARWPSSSHIGVQFTEFFISYSGVAVLCAVVAGCGWIVWSLNNYTGRGRDFLDRRVFPYTVFGQMDLLSVLAVLAALVKSGRQDVDALEIVMANSSKWVGYQLEKIKQFTKSGETVFGSLDTLPIAPLMAARIRVVAKNTRVTTQDRSSTDGDSLPSLIISACFDEGDNMTEKMTVKGQFVTVCVTFIIAAFLVMFLSSIYGFSQAAGDSAKVVRSGGR